MKKLILFLIFLNSIACSTKNDCNYQKAIDSDDGLNVTTLEERNLDKSVFDNINRDICNGGYGTIHSLLVSVDDELVVEQYYNGWKRDQSHFLASVTKGFTAILTVIALEKGYIDSLNQSMLDFFPEYRSNETDKRKLMVTIEHLLTMTSGFKWDELTRPFDDPKNDGVRLDKADNRLDASLKLQMDTIPGSKFVYCGPNDIILGEIIKRSSKQNIAAFAEQHLFSPLQIKDYNWESKNEIYATAGGLWLKSRDMLKFGQLLLNKGKVGNTQVVSENWIEKAFTPYIEIEHPLYSCYQWRMVKTEFGFNSWYISGYGGQIINMIPALRMVIVITADNRKVPKEERGSLEYLIKDLIKIHPKMKP